jgi:hypothetical protein
MSHTAIDQYFGQHLLMHVFPMAPMALNDHSILPGNATIDALYEDHQPLFDFMRPAQWVLTAKFVTLLPVLLSPAVVDTLAL